MVVELGNGGDVLVLVLALAVELLLLLHLARLGGFGSLRFGSLVLNGSFDSHCVDADVMSESTDRDEFSTKRLPCPRSTPSPLWGKDERSGWSPWISPLAKVDDDDVVLSFGVSTSGLPLFERPKAGDRDALETCLESLLSRSEPDRVKKLLSSSSSSSSLQLLSVSGLVEASLS